MKVGIITLAYDSFDFEKFYKNIEKNFLPNHTKIFYFFTNKTETIFPKNVQVYFSKKEKGLYSNISDVIDDLKPDKVQLLFYCGLNIKLDIETGSQLTPSDDFLFTSLDENNKPMFYNLTALLDHIEGKETTMIYGSYVDSFVDLINYYQDIELKDQDLFLEPPL